MKRPRRWRVSRRGALKAVAAGALAVVMRRSKAEPERVPAAVRERIGDRTVRWSRVLLDAPALAENGNSVGVRVRVDPARDDRSAIRRVSLIAPANPVPGLIDFEWPGGSDVARVETRIRLADTQTLFAIAETIDGELYGARTEVVVTLAACLDTFR